MARRSQVTLGPPRSAEKTTGTWPRWRSRRPRCRSRSRRHS